MRKDNTLKNRQNQYRRTVLINEASDNGRCWWVKQYIIGSITYRKQFLRRTGESS